MSEIPSLIEDLALILVVAGIVTLIFKRLKQPLVLGYIVAGFLVSPNMPYTASVVDHNSQDILQYQHTHHETCELLLPQTQIVESLIDNSCRRHG